MKAPFTALAAVVLAVVLAGCSASNMARPGDDGEPRLYSNNSTLANRLAVEALQDKQVGDLLYVQATLENGWKFELDFQYKIKWFDRDGFEVAPVSYTHLTLPTKRIV